MPNAKETKAREHIGKSVTALENAMAAIEAGKPVDLADAKVLEAAGCWLRRNMVSA